MSESEPIVIDDGGRPRRPGGGFLSERRLAIAGIVAVAEVGYVVFGDPGAFFGSVVATIILIGAVMLALRTARGPLRDVLWVIALAQVFVIAILSLKIIVSTIVIVLAVVAVLGGIVYFMGRSRLRKLGNGG
jgi:hypothetical protein